MDLSRDSGDSDDAGRDPLSLIDNIPGLVALLTSSGQLEFVNRQIVEYTGRSLEELRDWGTNDTVHPDDLAQVIATFTAAISAGTPYQIVQRLRRADGAYLWFQNSGCPVRDRSGRVSRWCVLLTNIHEWKSAQTQLAREIQLLEMVASGRPLTDVLNALCMFVEEIATDCRCSIGLIDWSGPAFQKAIEPSPPLPGFYDDAIHGVAVRDDIVPWSTPIYSLTGRVLGTFAIHQRTPAATTLLQQELIAQVTHIASIAIERAQSEAALRRSEAFLSEGQRLSLTGSFAWRVETDEITWSDQLYRILEYDSDVSPTLALIGARIHPEDLPVFQDTLDRARRDGSGFEYEQRLQMPDQSVKYLHVVAHPTRDDRGRLEYIGAVQDVTERRLAEEALARVSSELTRVTRITSLGTLTASLAHEVNQPLSGIITNAGTLLRMLAAEPPEIDGAREAARRTIRDGHRAADVVTRLRALFSNKEFRLEPLDLNEATREVIALSVSELQRNRIVLQSALADDLPRVVGDRIQIQQVILNLLRNAMDAMIAVPERPRRLLITTGRDADDRVRLTMSDNGVGLDRQDVARLFDSFYTTKSDGMGMGLSISRSIVDRHHGRLWAERHDGPGATFSMALPRHRDGDMHPPI